MIKTSVIIIGGTGMVGMHLVSLIEKSSHFELYVAGRNNQKLDRRIRKTRSILLKELVELMGEKEIKNISVKEISDRADINRGTFYLHYKDVYDMLDKVEEELFDNFNEILDKNQESYETNNPYPLLKDVFLYIDKNKNLVSAFLGPHGDLSFINQLTELVKKRMQFVWELHSLNTQYFEYYYSFIISGTVGLIKTWVFTGDDKTPDEMATLTSGILLQGFNVFSGLK